MVQVYLPSGQCGLPRHTSGRARRTLEIPWGNSRTGRFTVSWCRLNHLPIRRFDRPFVWHTAIVCFRTMRVGFVIADSAGGHTPSVRLAPTPASLAGDGLRLTPVGFAVSLTARPGMRVLSGTPPFSRTRIEGRFVICVFWVPIPMTGPTQLMAPTVGPQRRASAGQAIPREIVGAGPGEEAPTGPLGPAVALCGTSVRGLTSEASSCLESDG